MASIWTVVREAEASASKARAVRSGRDFGTIAFLCRREGVPDARTRSAGSAFGVHAGTIIIPGGPSRMRVLISPRFTPGWKAWPTVFVTIDHFAGDDVRHSCRSARNLFRGAGAVPPRHKGIQQPALSSRNFVFWVRIKFELYQGVAERILKEQLLWTRIFGTVG